MPYVDWVHRQLLSAGPLAMRAPWPAAGPTLAFLELLLGPSDAALSRHLLLGILDPAYELVAGQRRDVLPGIERRRIRDQRHAEVSWKLVHYPTGHSWAAHGGHGSCSGRADLPNGTDRQIRSSFRIQDRGRGTTRSQADRRPTMAELAAVSLTSSPRRRQTHQWAQRRLAVRGGRRYSASAMSRGSPGWRCSTPANPCGRSRASRRHPTRHPREWRMVAALGGRPRYRPAPPRGPCPPPAGAPSRQRA